MTIRKRQAQLKRHTFPGDPVEYGMAPEWQLENPDGYANFHTWIKRQLAKHREIDPVWFHLLRRDKTKVFGPDNCYLAPATPRRVSMSTEPIPDHVATLTSPALVSVRRITGWHGTQIECSQTHRLETHTPPKNCPMAHLESLFHLR